MEPSKRQGFTRKQDLEIDAFEAQQRERIRAHGDPEHDRQLAIREHNDRAIAEVNAHAEHLSELANDPRYAIPAISVVICQLDSQADRYQEKLQRERRIEQTGGVIDLRANRELAEGIEDNRSAVAAWKAHLREKFSVAPLSCSSMPRLAQCHADHDQCDHDSAEQDDLVRNGIEQLGH